MHSRALSHLACLREDWVEKKVIENLGRQSQDPLHLGGHPQRNHFWIFQFYKPAIPYTVILFSIVNQV